MQGLNNYNKVTQLLISLGFEVHLQGFRYIRELMIIGLSGGEILPLRGNGYTYLSRKYDKKEGAIEKAIANSITSALDNDNVSSLYSIFGETIDENKGKPTNKQFILTLIDIIRHSST